MIWRQTSVMWRTSLKAVARFFYRIFMSQNTANNFMMHLLVEDAESWHQHLSKVGHEEFGSRLTELVEQPWGMRECCLFDPSGVLWRIGQNMNTD